MRKFLLALAALLWLVPGTGEACQQYRNVLQDLNGNILPFGHITVYKANTNVAAVLYADSLCTVSTVNPTTSVQDGTFTFFAADGYYDLIFSYPNHSFSNVFSLPLFEPVLENMVPVAKYDNDICLPDTGAISQIGANPVWLWINKAVTCGTNRSIPNTLVPFITGAGSITETGGAVLSFNGVVIKPSRYTPITYSASMTPDALTSTIVEITATNNSAFTINAPLHPWQSGQITFVIRNTSGGALGTATWDVKYKLATWTQPATGFSRSITFFYDSGNWIEQSRTPADVPN